MKKIMFVASVMLMLASCDQRIKLPVDTKKNGYFVTFDTIKVADSTYVVNIIYQSRLSSDISAVKLCVINK